MPIDRFMIAPLNTGLQTNVKPWMIADDAFAQLNNAYVFRGRVRKRFGSLYMNGSTTNQLSTRLRIQVETTDGAGAVVGNVDGNVFAVGQLFSIGTEIYTVITAGGGPQPMLSTGAGTGTYDTATGVFTFAGAPALTPVFFYPATPVMGLLTNQLQSINDEELFAFDTQFAYRFIGGFWVRAGLAVWTGGDADFFWGWNFRGNVGDERLFFVTNFITADQIKYWDGALWTNFAPVINNSGDFVQTARIIVDLFGHLVLFNTVERVGVTDREFPQRARWSQVDDALSVNAFNKEVSPTAGFIDAPTSEAITSAYFIKNRLIVFFESSTWEFVYTGNEADPFIWQRINSELGSESTFSTVPFDKVLLTVGDVGIHACNGANVQRVDDKIPDTVFEVHNGNDGVFRVAGIRDYFVEMVYWAFPSDINNPTYPNRVLVYNYKNGAWAFNNDTITAFGYFNNPLGITWGVNDHPWGEELENWGSGTLQSKFRQVTAGNQQGFVFLVYPDVSTNAPVMQITDMSFAGIFLTVVVINHNLVQGDFIKIENVEGMSNVNNLIYKANVVDADTLKLFMPPAPANTSPNPLPNPTGTYTGGGTIRRVTPIDIYTKQYNFYGQQGRNALINKVDFNVDKTSIGELSVDFLPSFDLDGIGSFRSYEFPINPAQVGLSILETFPYTDTNMPSMVGTEENRTQLWHSLYFNGEGQVVQMRFFLQDLQVFKFVLDNAGNRQFVADQNFELNAMMIYAQPTTSRFQ